MRTECNRMPFPIILFLAKNAASGKPGGVDLHTCFSIGIVDSQNWRRHEVPLELVEGGLFFVTPMPRRILLGEVIQGSSDLREVLDKPPVEVGESSKLLDAFDRRRGRPVCDTTDFDRIHADFPSADNHPKVLGFWYIPFAFLRFKE